jgi:hypothetical protein
MKSVSEIKAELLKDYTGPQTLAFGTPEWLEAIYGIRRKVDHLYFCRNEGFKKLTKDPMSIGYFPMMSGDQDLTDDEYFVFAMYLDAIIKGQMNQPKFGKDEVETLSHLNKLCQISLLGEPYLHLQPDAPEDTTTH